METGVVAYIPKALRQQVIERAKELCEYCQAPQLILVEMEMDHIVPESAGGMTTADNLCLSCGRCNGYKSAFQAGIDPESGEEMTLFNPRTQHWSDHFRWTDDLTSVIGRTSIGRATINRLNMNEPIVVQARSYWLQAGWRPHLE